jgi:hypothetical protein
MIHHAVAHLTHHAGLHRHALPGRRLLRVVLIMGALAKRRIASAQQEDERQCGGSARNSRHDSAPFDPPAAPLARAASSKSRF